MIYFISAEPDGPIKIGYASNPKKRIASLQTAHHQQLKLLKVIPGTLQAEAALHALFKNDRIKGEWFKRSPSLLSFIESDDAWKSAVADEDMISANSTDHPHAQYIIALGDTGTLAADLGVVPQAVSNWKKRGIPWRMRPVVQNLARRKRIKLPADFLTTKAL